MFDDPYFRHGLDANALPPGVRVASLLFAFTIVGGVLLDAFTTAAGIVA
jgi:hypothetical protein